MLVCIYLLTATKEIPLQCRDLLLDHSNPVIGLVIQKVY